MTQKELMLSENFYHANDVELAAERLRVRKLTKKYNALSPSKINRKNHLLYKILGKRGENCIIHPPFYCDYGYNIEIGENFFANYNCIMLDVNKIVIGDNVMLGPRVTISTAGHPIHPNDRKRGYEYGKKISIGNNVWIGANVVLNPGISIGNNVVIGSGSVVISNLPANTVCVGNPAHVVKKITEDLRQFT